MDYDFPKTFISGISKHSLTPSTLYYIPQPLYCHCECKTENLVHSFSVTLSSASKNVMKASLSLPRFYFAFNIQEIRANQLTYIPPEIIRKPTVH